MEALGIVNFGLFAAAVLLLNVTPGPDTAYIVGRSLAQGRTAGLVSALGISAGCCVHALALAVGLSALLQASAAAFTAIKLAGGIYLAWLGLRMLLARPPAAQESAAQAPARSLSTIFLQALATNVLNPKVILFFLAFIPQFVRAEAAHKSLGFLLLGLALALISLAWNSVTAMLAGTLARRASRSPQLRLWLERTVGASFIALGARLALSRS